MSIPVRDHDAIGLLVQMVGLQQKTVVGLDHIHKTLHQINNTLKIQGAVTMANLDELTAQVQRTTDLQTSAITLINGLADQLEEAADDPAAIAALSTQLRDSADAFAAALADPGTDEPVDNGGEPEPAPES